MVLCVLGLITSPPFWHHNILSKASRTWTSAVVALRNNLIDRFPSNLGSIVTVARSLLIFPAVSLSWQPSNFEFCVAWLWTTIRIKGAPIQRDRQKPRLEQIFLFFFWSQCHKNLPGDDLCRGVRLFFGRLSAAAGGSPSAEKQRRSPSGYAVHSFLLSAVPRLFVSSQNLKCLIPGKLFLRLISVAKKPPKFFLLFWCVCCYMITT